MSKSKKTLQPQNHTHKTLHEKDSYFPISMLKYLII